MRPGGCALVPLLGPIDSTSMSWQAAQLHARANHGVSWRQVGGTTGV